ncbi:FG-GAP repeat domain-containing protein [Bacteroidota bacterium]
MKFIPRASSFLILTVLFPLVIYSQVNPKGFGPKDNLLNPTFTNINTGLAPVYGSSTDWGDYDNDGDLDILLLGNYTSKIYRNNGNGAFTDINAGLIGLNDAAGEWGDYDNDGDLDFIISGLTDITYIPTSIIYRNEGNDNFIDIQANIAGFYHTDCDWGDYDNDGDLDILISGRKQGGIIATHIYNNSDEIFNLAPINISGVCYLPANEFSDFDNDGDLDIVVSGTTNMSSYNPITKIFSNDGNNVFTEITYTFEGVYLCDLDCADYDNDGDMDFAISGKNVSGNTSGHIYRNDGNFQFTDIPGFGSWWSAIEWGDCDNDGDLDIIITGASASIIYRNDGNNVFTNLNAGLAGVEQGSVAWGDYDNDMDLDIVLTGETGTNNPVSIIYRNDGTNYNTAPSAPSNLSYNINANQYILSWDPSTDSETPHAGLTYNIRIGTSPNAIDIKSPLTNLANGYRKIVDFGNTDNNLYHRAQQSEIKSKKN